VRYPTGEMTYGIQTLTVVQLFFQLFAVGDVPIDPIHADLIIFQADRVSQDRYVDQGPVFMLAHGFKIHSIAPRYSGCRVPALISQMVRDDQVVYSFSSGFFQAVPENPGEFLVYSQDDLVIIQNHDAFGSPFDQFVQISILHQQGFFVLLQLGHITQDAHRSCYRSGFIQNGSTADSDPDQISGQFFASHQIRIRDSVLAESVFIFDSVPVTFIYQQLVTSLASQILFPVSIHFTRGRVYKLDHVIVIDHDHAFAHGFNQLAVFIFTLPQGFGCLLALQGQSGQLTKGAQDLKGRIGRSLLHSQQRGAEETVVADVSNPQIVFDV